MKISFVIPAYNEERLIGKCLESVRAEIARSAHSCEIIVVDNGSTDGTLEVARRFPGVRIVTETWKGANRARQAGLKAALGEYVAHIDADTILPEGWMLRAIQELDRRLDMVAMSGPFIYYDLLPAERVLAWTFISTYPAVNFLVQHVLRAGALLQGGNYVARRSALEAVGGHDTRIEFYGDDTDLARRLSKVGSVRWFPSFSMYASGRRLRKEGMVPTAFRYTINFFSVNFAGKPLTKQYADIRLE